MTPAFRDSAKGCDLGGTKTEEQQLSSAFEFVEADFGEIGPSPLQQGQLAHIDNSRTAGGHGQLKVI